MIKSSAPEDGIRRPGRPGEQAKIRMVTLAAVLLVLGFAGGAFWYHHWANSSGGSAENGGSGSLQSGVLSDATKAVLQRLQDPVEVRSYSLLDPTGASDALKGFAGRVDQ